MVEHVLHHRLDCMSLISGDAAAGVKDVARCGKNVVGRLR
jgi:hypothetical protein